MQKIAILLFCFFLYPVFGVADSHLPQRNCLVSEADEGLSMIDYSAIRSLSDLEECVGHKATQFNDQALLSKWLISNDFVVSPEAVVPEAVMMIRYGIEGTGLRVGASMRREDIQLRMGFLDRFLIQSLSLAIIFDQFGKLMEVQATYSRT